MLKIVENSIVVARCCKYIFLYAPLLPLGKAKTAGNMTHPLPSVNLLPEDHQEIVGGKWLSDNVINAAHRSF